MKHFSHEYREHLINEHKMISASIVRLTDPQHGAMQYARAHGHDAVAAAASNLKTRKVELEAQIDLLTEFLN